MAEETKEQSVVEETNEKASAQEEQETAEKTFTQAELDAIIQKLSVRLKRNTKPKLTKQNGCGR